MEFFQLPISFSQNDKLNNCFYPATHNTLNINNISAKFYSGGDMHWNIFTNGANNYEFPKGSGKNASGAAALWIGGLDSFGQLRMGAMTYRQNGIDFWPGPLDTINGYASSGICSQFDVAPKVSTNDLNSFITDYYYRTTTNSTYSLNQNLQLWAANTITANDITSKLAPFVDVNKNGIYNPLADGDYPDIRGDQMIYFVSNDNGGIHTETMASSLGVEIHHSIYAYGCDKTLNNYPELKNAIFHHYRIYNRSSFTFSKTVVGMWSSSGIGDNNDDYIGSNPQKGYAYSYNGDSFDNLYGNILPATAIVVLKSTFADNNDLIDNNGNGIIDEPMEEMSVPNVFYYKTAMPTFSTVASAVSDPQLGIHYYNYLTGYWKDGSSFTCGADAYNGITSTKHVFPEEVVLNSSCNYTWTEKSENNIPGQRSYIICTQPFTLKAKSFIDLDYAFVSAIDSSAPNDNWASVIKLKQEVQKIKNFYQLPVKPSCLENRIVNGTKASPNISVFPNPTENIVTLASNNEILDFRIFDVFGQLLVFRENVRDVKTQFDFSVFAKGLYLIKIRTAEGTYLLKEIVK